MLLFRNLRRMGAFAGLGRELDVRGDDGVRLCEVVSVGLGRWAGCANGAKRSPAGTGCLWE